MIWGICKCNWTIKYLLRAINKKDFFKSTNRPSSNLVRIQIISVANYFFLKSRTNYLAKLESRHIFSKDSTSYSFVPEQCITFNKQEYHITSIIPFSQCICSDLKSRTELVQEGFLHQCPFAFLSCSCNRLTEEHVNDQGCRY